MSKNGGKSNNKRRKYGDEDYDSEYDSDYSNDDIIPPKIMYGTINTLYKEYIKCLDLEAQPEFMELGKKYMSRAIFNIDKTEHKKFQKEKRREVKKLKKQLAHKEAMKKKSENQQKANNGNSAKSPNPKYANISPSKPKSTKKRVLKKL